MKSILIGLCLIFSTFISAQELVVGWGQCYGADYYHSKAYSLEVLPNENTVISLAVTENNNAFSNYHGEADAWVVVFDSFGNIINERCFGGSDGDLFLDIETHEDYVYFVGQTMSTDGDVQSDPVGGYYNIWIVKTDLDLNILWEKQYGCVGTQSLDAAKVTPSGGLIFVMDFGGAAGGDVSEYYGESDIWVCEINPNGDIIWEKTLGNESYQNSENIFLKDDGTCIVLGATNSIGGMIEGDFHGGSDIWLVALDPITHDIIWQGCYGGSNMDIVQNIIPYGTGYYVLSMTKSVDGNISNNHSDRLDAWLFEISSNGEIIWSKCFGGTRDETFRNAFFTEDENVLIFGATNSIDGDVNQTHCPYANCYYNTWVVELNSDREIIWNKVVGPIGLDSVYETNAIKRVGERDFIISAIIHDPDNHSGDVDCEPYPINNGQSAWVFRLYDPTTDIETLPTASEISTYPNPSNNQVVFELPHNSQTSHLTIINRLGQEITTIQIQPYQEKIVWNCNHQPNGLYFYQTEIEGVIYTGKVMVMD